MLGGHLFVDYNGRVFEVTPSSLDVSQVRDELELSAEARKLHKEVASISDAGRFGDDDIETYTVYTANDNKFYIIGGAIGGLALVVLGIGIVLVLCFTPLGLLYCTITSVFCIIIPYHFQNFAT